MKNRIHVRTLVIDDDATVCRRLAGWLDAQGHEVLTFTDPAAGMERAKQSSCELALVDLRLPDADGAEVIERLCEASPHTRVVAMSAFPQADQVRRAIRAGARDLIEKPIQQRVLLKVLERQLAEIGIPVRSERQFNRRLGARLRKVRQEARRTQQEVAEAAGITPAQLSQIELGKTATSTWTLARISGALRIRLASLFNGL
ncbi:MAG: response regulator [Phycisphaerae bacterium]